MRLEVSRLKGIPHPWQGEIKEENCVVEGPGDLYT